ncbi:uncharacterized protein SRS1_15511 [Sporisorium reilianum f. sp. reilianum]|uniref:DRBM domain-containing protein n=1 Tax=Sporisorium reilianum f. sp. reilianum TaxID=72559 RepID=A0A2N8UIB8_9BASI|nr:uncharacterized protein SRS1_15511 [Sporisorium reilianum f. sp. reilianum]
MPDASLHAQTTANLTAAGGKTIPQYLEGAFPHKDTSDAVAVAVASTPAPTSAQVAAAPDKEPTILDKITERLDAEASGQVPLYIKVKGKGKGRPVMFDWDKSSVAQVYEYAAQMSVPNPVFDHVAGGAAHLRTFTVTVKFDGLSATSAMAGSIKEAKESACDVLVQEMLDRNRDVYRLKA